MRERPDILVVGSINMDLVVRTPHVPLPGQTVMGYNFITSPGGKGANQAVGVARLGGQCRFIGRVGSDAFGTQLLANMRNEGIDCSDVMVTPEAPTGVAIIIVDAQGENRIVVAPGANYLVTPDDLFSREEVFKQASIVMLQLELPMPTVRAAVEVARRNGCKVMLDPAPMPAQGLCADLCKVDVLSPNTTEAEALSGHTVVDAGGDKLVATDLITRGAQAAVLKLGPRGCLAVMADGHFYTVPPYKVDVVDTTAAGDAFNAALAVALARGDNMHQAAKFATAAGAMACTKFGAQAAMPTLDEVKSLQVRSAEMEM